MNAKDTKLHAKAVKQFNATQQLEREQRRLAVEDLRFANVEDGQWEDEAKDSREGRPRYTINRVSAAINQVTGDQRQNRTQIKLEPVSGQDNSKILSGLIRSIERRSKASNAYDNAFDEAVTCGYGGWRILTGYESEYSFDQEVKIAPINSACSSLWFGHAEEYDKRGAPHAFLTTTMSKEEYKDEYPNASLESFNSEQLSADTIGAWFGGDNVQIAEYWWKEPKKRKIALLSNGFTIDMEEEKEALDELMAAGITVVKERAAVIDKVYMRKMNGVEFLGKVQEFAGKFIPLVPLYGRISHIEGETFIRGIVRQAKDPQRIYNYATSQAIEVVALAPKDPYFVTPKQIEGHIPAYNTHAVKNQPFLPYNPDPEAPGPPTRGGAPSVPQALIAQIQQSATDIHATTGIEPPSLGNSPELKSGKAILAQQAMGDRGAFVYTDNLKKSIQYTGEILADLLPRIYDTERVVRVVGEDTASEQMPINVPVKDASGETIIVNDLAQGKYSVYVESGPAYSTMRKESVSQLTELAAQNEDFASISLDLIAKQLDMLDSEEVAKRARKMQIQRGIATPTQEEIEEMGLNQPQAPDPTQTAMTDNISAQTEKLAAEIRNKDADTAQKTIKTQQTTIDAYKSLVDALTAKAEAGVPLSEQDRENLIKQGDIVAEGQQAIDEGPNSEQLEDMSQMAERDAQAQLQAEMEQQGISLPNTDISL